MAEQRPFPPSIDAAQRDLPPVRLWRIHLGVHKTATTHLQETLAAIRPQLAERRVDAVPNADIRPLWQQLLPPRSNWRRWLVGPWTVRRLSHAFDGLRIGPDTVLLSEENFLGHTRDALCPRPYPVLGSRLRVLASLGRTADMRIFLSIRRMDQFLGSVYAEALRFFRFDAPFEVLGPRFAADPPRWTEVIDRIRRAMPGVPLTVWRYEDYAAHRDEITTLFCGTDPGPLPDIARPPQTQTPSDAAVRAAERVDRSLGYKDHVDAVAQIYAAAPASPEAPGFRPFSEAEAARFAAAYKADCQALENEGLLQRF